LVVDVVGRGLEVLLFERVGILGVDLVRVIVMWRKRTMLAVSVIELAFPLFLLFLKIVGRTAGTMVFEIRDTCTDRL
jgi:hypothetical protein